MGTAVLNVRHGPESDSFCNRSFPSGQYSKVSIGILAERTPNFGSQPTKEDEAVLPAEEKAPQSQAKSLECNQEMRKKVCMSDYRTEPESAKVVACVPSRSTSHANPSSSARVFINQNDLLQLGGIHKKCEKNKKKNATMQNVEVAHASWENHTQDKEKPRENIEHVRTFDNESLRLKLWEALGSAPLQNKQVHSSQHMKEDTTIPPIEKMCEQQNANINQNKQNSDTIETDSDSPRNNVRRPVTRSLTRRKSIKRPVANLKFGTNSARKQLSSTVGVHKEKDADENAFSFNEKAGIMGGLEWPANNRSSTGIRKQSNRNTFKVESCRVSFPRESALEKASKSSENKQIPSVVCVGDDIVGATYSSPKDKVHILHQSNASDEKMLQNSETGQKLNLNTPSPEKYMGLNERDSPSKTYTSSPKSTSGQPLSADKNMYENIDSSPMFRYPWSICGIQSPTFAVNITSASQKETPSEQVHCSNTMKEKPSDSVTLSSSRLQFSDSDACVGTSNHMRYSTEPSFEGMQHFKKNKPGVHLSQSQRTLDGDSSQADEVSNQVAGARKGKCSSDAGTNMTSPISFPCSKRLHYLGADEGKQFREIPEQLSEDGLPRAIFQLQMVLERFKAKIKSHKSKKSSQILSLVGDKIRLQLQDVESQIQADMGKFTSLTKAKRKRLESTFQEQQERLKIIHEKFKQEVSQHLLECRGTLEELESFQMEIKTSAELQKASHRKLLMQVEEAMEAQLNDAETSIATIQKVGRKKMDNLRHALREWLGKGIP